MNNGDNQQCGVPLLKVKNRLPVHGRTARSDSRDRTNFRGIVAVTRERNATRAASAVGSSSAVTTSQNTVIVMRRVTTLPLPTCCRSSTTMLQLWWRKTRWKINCAQSDRFLVGGVAPGWSGVDTFAQFALSEVVPQTDANPVSFVQGGVRGLCPDPHFRPNLCARRACPSHNSLTW